MSSIASFQTLVQTNLESAKTKLASASDRFTKNPMCGVDFGWHLEMALYDELAKYFNELNVATTAATTSEGLTTMTDEIVSANMRRWMNQLIQETSPIKRDVWKAILKFWYNVASMYQIKLGELGHFQYSV